MKTYIKTKNSYNQIIAVFLLFLPGLLYPQNVEFKYNILCSTNKAYDEDNMLKRCNNKLYAMVLNKNKNLIYCINIHQADKYNIDTVVILHDEALPLDFTLDEKGENLFCLYGSEIIKFSLNSNKTESIKLEVGYASKIELFSDSVLYAINYFIQDKNYNPIVERINFNNHLHERFYLKTENYSAFYSALSPTQKKQVESVEYGFVFFDYTSGAIELFHFANNTSYIICNPKYNLEEIKKIKKLVAKYNRNPTIKTLEQITDNLYDSFKSIILQFLYTDSNKFLIIKLEEKESLETYNGYVFQYMHLDTNINTISIIDSFSFLRSNANFKLPVSSTNFTLIDIVNYPAAYLNGDLYLFQYMNSCISDNGKKLGDYYADRERKWLLNSYKLNTGK